MIIKTTEHSQQAMVAEFMNAMGQKTSCGFRDFEARCLGIRLIEEEFHELQDAISARLFRNEELIQLSAENLIKEMTDLLYVINWTACAIGIDLEEAFKRVHASNMSKLGEDGKPIFREDGKVLKGPNYHKPDLSDIVQNTPVTF